MKISKSGCLAAGFLTVLAVCLCLMGCGQAETSEAAETTTAASDETAASDTVEADTVSGGEDETMNSEEDQYAISTMPLMITMTVTGIDGNTVTAVIDNHSGYDMTYLSAYTLEKKIDGEWMEMPVLAVVDYAEAEHEISDRETVTLDYDLSIFGDENGEASDSLPAGEYRLNVGDLKAEFKVEK